MRLLRMAWPYLAAIALLLGMQQCYAWRIRAAHAAGRADTLREAAAVAPHQRDTVRIAVQRTDTVVRVVRAQAERVRDVADRVPDTVRVAFPVVDTLVREVDALTDSLPVLLATVQTERAAHQALALNLSLVTVAKSDTIRVLRKRPTRLRAALLAATVSTITYFVGAR